MDSRLKEYKVMTESFLASLFKEPDAPHGKLLEAMRYSLLAGGKRIRPALTMEFCRTCGGDPVDALPAACAVEMIHTYSLIHDDLPCMDNDDLRRGKPTNHKVFGEATAVLAGDTLQAEAFLLILSSALPANVKVECAGMLAAAAGQDGMCGGQQLDLEGEEKVLSEQELLLINSKKTSAMIRAACTMGVSVGGGSPEQLKAAADYAENLGLAFQIRDDMLDVISTDETLGKPIGSDEKEGKTTFMSLYGMEKCQEAVEKYTSKAKQAIEEHFDEPEFLCALADSLTARMN